LQAAAAAYTHLLENSLLSQQSQVYCYSSNRQQYFIDRPNNTTMTYFPSTLCTCSNILMQTAEH
jgi:hypothetical protein